jgi:outer membrane protein assembly factor BamB
MFAFVLHMAGFFVHALRRGKKSATSQSDHKPAQFRGMVRMISGGRPGAISAWVGTGMLLLSLLGCSSTSGGQARTNTPPPGPPPTVMPTPSPLQGNDWPTYHHDTTRTGYLANEPDPTKLSRTWAIQLDGAVYAEPLVVNGHVIVATENDSLYALDATNGQQIWHVNLGTPERRSDLPCGDIDPLGITGTPVYDPATNQIFAVAETTGAHHFLVGVNAATGKVNFRRNVDVPNKDPHPFQQRTALLLSQGHVYWTYGGLAGDCGNYVGTVMGLPTNGQGSPYIYQVPTAREGGIWAPPGASADAEGDIYVSVGNGASVLGNWDHSDSVLRLSPTLQLKDGFAPSQWPQDNATDADLGSTSPTLLPNGIVFISGKSSRGYTLHIGNLGGVNGQIQTTDVCQQLSMGGTAHVDTTIIVPCTDGLQQIQVDSNGEMHLGWHEPQSIHMPPVIGGHTVYSLSSDGVLYALNLTNGKVRTSLYLGSSIQNFAIPTFATPTVAGGHIFAGTMSGIVGVTIA